jgi:hypothetical protein
VTNVRFVIFACGAVLLGLLIADGLYLRDNGGDAFMMLAAYAVPTALGALAIARPPLRTWQAGFALAGFGIAAVRTRIWSGVANIGEASSTGKLAIALLIVGLIASAIAIARPSER